MNTIIKSSSSNIALVKYWGKHGTQLPMNPSISMTLKNAITTTSIRWKELEKSNEQKVSLLFEGKNNHDFEKRLALFIDHITEYIPVLKNLKLDVESSNSFPHSSGIASSASAMSAFALSLIELEKQETGKISGFKDELQKASFIARLGSGSAARSIYNGYSVWGKTDAYKGSSDEYALAINSEVHEVFKNYHDAILIVSSQAKKVGSSLGHSLMNNHPFAAERFKQAENNIVQLKDILKNGEQHDYTKVVESEALSLHAMMMTSNPSFILMEPNTLNIISKVQVFREETGIPLCFTLDAGANVHILYPEDNKESIVKWIKSELVIYCSDGKWIDDEIKI